MKNCLLWIFFVCSVGVQAATQESAALPTLAPTPSQARAADLVAHILRLHAYQAKPDGKLTAAGISERYLKALDPEKLYFMQSDVDSLFKEDGQFDDEIYHQDLHTPFQVFNTCQTRIAEFLTVARQLVSRGFNFDENELYQYDREKEPWAQSKEALHDLWRRRVKNDWLELKLAGESDESIRRTLDKRYGNALTLVLKTNSEDAFMAFMDAYTTSVDPHTEYFDLKSLEEFNIDMKLSLVGIGIVVEQRDVYLTVRELLPGGPAALSNKLHVGDRLVGVGQGNNGAFVNVIGWRNDDLTKLIHGAEGSVLRLDVIPVNAGAMGKHKHVTLVRNTVKLEEQAASKSIVQVKVGEGTRQVGVISLPSFYEDFEAREKGDKNYRSATRDVARLLDELVQAKVDSVIVDLRNNGGGALDEAIEMTGLFIDAGPVVQVRDADGAVDVKVARSEKAVWTGTLGVLINRGSASASEIFSAAIQDYGRGLIIGETSFGKGTVQTMIDLDELAHNEQPEFGGLKMTIAQFFRIDGSTTQLAGVTPDVGFPSTFDPGRFGESSFDNALPWRKIEPANYTPLADTKHLLPLLKSNHSSRMEQDQDFQRLLARLAELKSLRDKNAVSLNAAERRKEDEAERGLDAQSDAADKAAQNKNVKDTKTVAAEMDTAQPGAGAATNDSSVNLELEVEKTRKEIEAILLKESAHILVDEADAATPGTSFNR